MEIVKYRLLKFGKGYIAPSAIVDGGETWSGGSLAETVLVGKADIPESGILPEGVIEVISQETLDAHRAGRTEENLKRRKRHLYEKHTDHLFIEALRDKLVFKDSTKWDEYVKLYKRIHDTGNL